MSKQATGGDPEDAHEDEGAVASKRRDPHGERASVPGKMGDEESPTDFGKPVEPVPPEEIEGPSGPGNIGDD
jgi:hypothetical protein